MDYFDMIALSLKHYNQSNLIQIRMSQEQGEVQNQEQAQEISIQDLQLSLEVYEIESEQKLQKLQALFSQKKTVDPNKMFYQDRSSLEIKFQNIISDLTEFLINQQIASTDKLRKIFFRLLQNPLIFLFKVSRFEIFNLRLNAFDIELDPIDAISQLGLSILANISKHQQLNTPNKTQASGYQSYEHFLYEAQSKLIQDQIFLFYSYLRKGGNIIRKKFEDKVRVVQLYGKIEEQLLKRCIENGDSKTLKQLSTLNYQLYLLQNSFDVLCFYLKVPFKAEFIEAFKELENLGTKAKQSSNYDLFILIFLRYSQEILLKLQKQGMDSVFSSYIENALTCLLQLWGCRLCYFQQFYELFQKLLNLHPKRHVAIEVCLKHSPKLQKDDIVLLRTHFKHDLLQKHSQLLSLLRKKTIEEINASLNDLYHRTLYNLDFKQFSREEIINMLTVLNGNSSLQEFFGVVERALKQWNRTIGLSQTHKYIQSQYQFPKIEKSKIIESITLFNNLCVLEEKGLKDFEQLVKVGSIQRAFLDLSSFLLTSEEGSTIVKETQLVKLYLSNVLQFLKRTGNNNSNWESICSTFTSKLEILTQKYAPSIIEIILQVTANYHQSFTVKSIFSIYQQIIIAQKELKLPFQSSVSSLTNIFMKGTSQKNQQVKLLRFFDSNINDKVVLTTPESDFIKKNCVLNGQTLQPKNYGCFVLSDLELITNPVQFDKVMDNYYFTLDNNAKKYVQFIANQCHNLLTSKQDRKAEVCLSFMHKLIQSYPIAIPIFCTTRIYLPNNVTKRFTQVLVDNTTQQSFRILQLIIEFRGIRYRNGRDYVKQQIIPLILKECIKQVNESSQNIYFYELLALCLKNSRCLDIKIDLIQKVIEAINSQLSLTKEASLIFRLSKAHSELLSKFFQKKEVDMRKKDLKKTYHQLALYDIKTKNSPVQLDDNQKAIKKVVLSDQIMITPFAISPQFNAEDKLEKVNNSTQKNEPAKKIELSSLRSLLPVKQAAVSLLSQKANQTFKTMDLSGIKYNIECHIGQFKSFCLKQGFKIVTNKNDQAQQLQSNEQNVTLVQYYLKQFANPELSSTTILNYIQALINGQVSYSSLFSNYPNLQKLFFGLIYIFRFAITSNSVPKPIENTNHVLNISIQNRLPVAKAILSILSSIGYHNLWAESYNILCSLNYYKDLKQLSGFKQQSADETFFSWLLKVSLEKEDLKIELNTLLGSIFSSRPKDQTSLMYKVSIDRPLLNLIMKSLSITNLSFVSLLFNSNFNNLRLYTDQLHQGLKALGMASKNRAYNEYAQLSKDIEDQQFFLPMKLFKENFSFFIRIEKEGYKFKRGEEEKLAKQRILKVLRSGVSGEQLNKQVQKVIQEFEEQIEKLQYNIASRVKSFYLATKLRDLSYQNSLTVCLLHQILAQKKQETSIILQKIRKIELFSLMSELYNELVRFGRNSYANFLIGDRTTAQKQLNICSTRRYSHSMSKVYEKCELQLDEVFQRCIDVLRVFFASPEGKSWLSQLNVYPPFLCKSFINFTKGQQLIASLKELNNKSMPIQQVQGTLSSEQFSFTNLLKGLKSLTKTQLLSLNAVKIAYKNSTHTLSEFLNPFKNYLIQSETLSKSKDGYLLFNKYKTSQKTLQELQILGLLTGYCVYHNIEMDLPLHSSLLSVANFGTCDLDDLIDIDFKVWQDLRTVLSTSQSKDLGLNFSYIFQSLETLKPERVQLIDKGTSKKVNNLNREQYADSVCCYLLHRLVHKQINRFVQSLIYICPKEILSCLSLHHFLSLFLKKYPKYLNDIVRRIMKRRGLILAPSVIVSGKRYENTLDYQSIQWFNQIIQNQVPIRQKLWPSQTNLFVCTSMTQGAVIDISCQTLVIGRFNNKQELKQSLLKQI